MQNTSNFLGNIYRGDVTNNRGAALQSRWERYNFVRGKLAQLVERPTSNTKCHAFEFILPEQAALLDFEII